MIDDGLKKKKNWVKSPNTRSRLWEQDNLIECKINKYIQNSTPSQLKKNY
jgi:hypothetical protein